MPDDQIPDPSSSLTIGVADGWCERTRFSTFAECPHCGAGMAPEHAHFRCTACGWRDSCCD